MLGIVWLINFCILLEFTQKRTRKTHIIIVITVFTKIFKYYYLINYYFRNCSRNFARNTVRRRIQCWCQHHIGIPYPLEYRRRNSYWFEFPQALHTRYTMWCVRSKDSLEWCKMLSSPSPFHRIPFSLTGSPHWLLALALRSLSRSTSSCRPFFSF